MNLLRHRRHFYRSSFILTHPEHQFSQMQIIGTSRRSFFFLLLLFLLDAAANWTRGCEQQRRKLRNHTADFFFRDVDEVSGGN